MCVRWYKFRLSDVVINSFNVNGLRNDLKRKDIFSYFKSRKLDIVLLQETHSKPEDEKLWLKEWGGEIWFAHGTSQSRGVAVLVSKSALQGSLRVSDVQTGFEGRFLLLEIEIHETTFLLVNFYGPNEDDENFFINAFEKVEAKENPNMILAGDFNTTLNPDLDARTDPVNHKKKWAVIQNYVEIRELIDVWRVENPNKYQYTWKRDRTASVSSRIDYFLVSQSLMGKVTKTDIIPGYRSDHWRLELKMDFQTQARGKGFWKLNTSHLRDPNFIEELNVVIDRYLWEVKPDITPAQIWEYFKLEVTTFCTEFSIRKSKEQNRLIEKLETKLRKLDELLLTSVDENIKEEIASKIRRTEEFLLNEHEEMTEKKAAFLKARWQNFGERNNRYFFNLAKAKYNSKVISKLKTSSGSMVTDPKEVLQELGGFYARLFKVENWHRNFPYVNENGPKLSDEDRDLLEIPLNLSELSTALSKMENNKTPGCDGLPAEFYKMFWVKIKYILFEALSYALQVGILHKTATRSLFSLLPKKDRDPLVTRNWRPLSLLNLDYKILTKALALRMKPFLPQIINEDQTGFMAGRNINHNTRKILDIIKIAERDNLRALVVSVDFESCFDRISHKAIDNSLKFFNFGPVFRDFVQTILKNAEACVLNNGHITQWFQIQRSAGQGCCLSPFLALCNLEVLVIQLRNNDKIKGISVGDTMHKIVQLADDLNLLVMFDQETLTEIMKTLDVFFVATGFKVNYDKTSIYRIGSLKDSDAKLYSQRPLNWTNEPIRVLGTVVGCDSTQCNRINFEEIITKMEHTCQMWENRDLSLFGKVLVINTLVGSLFVHKLCNMDNLTKAQVERTHKIINAFLWGKDKKVKISLSKLSNTKEFGGLKLLEIATKDNALKTQWVANCKKFAKIQNLAEYFLPPKIGIDFWKCNLKPEDVNVVFQEQSFWSQVAYSWAKFNWHHPETTLQVLEEVIWFNSNIKIDNEVLFYEQVRNKGCFQINDLIEGPPLNFLSYNDFCTKYGNELGWLDYTALINAIPVAWRRMIKNPIIDHELDKNYLLKFELIPEKISNMVYTDLVQDRNKLKSEHSKWNEKLNQHNLQISYDSFLPSFLQINNLTSVPKLKSFQFRLLHRKIFLNKILKIWKLAESDRCTWCQDDYETLEHFFYFCPIVQQFWNKLRCWYECLTDAEIVLTYKDIMFNNSTFENEGIFLNACILVAKQFMFGSRCQGKTELNFYVFKEKLMVLIKNELRTIKYSTKNKQKEFSKKWNPLLK